MSQDNDSSATYAQGPADHFSLLSDRDRARIWARICGPEHGKKISEQVCPQGFNRHVTPDLAWVIRGWACFVRLEMCCYAEAYDSCLAYAWRRGAWGFSADHLADLQDWIHSSLDLAIDPAIDGQEV